MDSTRTVEYQAWRNAKSRCDNPRAQAYKNYGARGITFDPRWRTFAHFLRDMGKRPSPDHSLERKDNNGPYSPENCVWATRVEQCRNRRSNRRLTYQGETRTLSAWAEVFGISTQVLHYRLRKKWPLQKAFVPKLPNRRGPAKKRTSSASKRGHLKASPSTARITTRALP